MTPERSLVLLGVVGIGRFDGKYIALLNGGHEIEVTKAEYDRLQDYIFVKNKMELDRCGLGFPDDGTIEAVQRRVRDQSHGN